MIIRSGYFTTKRLLLFVFLYVFIGILTNNALFLESERMPSDIATEFTSEVIMEKPRCEIKVNFRADTVSWQSRRRRHHIRHDAAGSMNHSTVAATTNVSQEQLSRQIPGKRGNKSIQGVKDYNNLSPTGKTRDIKVGKRNQEGPSPRHSLPKANEAEVAFTGDRVKLSIARDKWIETQKILPDGSGKHSNDVDFNFGVLHIFKDIAHFCNYLVRTLHRQPYLAIFVRLM